MSLRSSSQQPPVIYVKCGRHVGPVTWVRYRSAMSLTCNSDFYSNDAYVCFTFTKITFLSNFWSSKLTPGSCNIQNILSISHGIQQYANDEVGKNELNQGRISKYDECSVVEHLIRIPDHIISD